MKQLINFKPGEPDRVLRLMAKYVHDIELKNIFMEYTVRYPFEDCTCTIDVEVRRTYYYFTVTPEASILSMKPAPIKPFNVGLFFQHNKIIYPIQPKDNNAMAWLQTPTTIGKQETSKASALLQFATSAMALFQVFWAGCERRENGDIITWTLKKDFTKLAEESAINWITQDRTEEALEGWDVVNLTNKQLVKLCQTLEKHDIKYDFMNFSLPSFALSFFDGKNTMYYFFKVEGQELHCTIFNPLPKGRTVPFMIKFTPHGEDRVVMDMYAEEKDNAVLEEGGEGSSRWEWCANAFWAINTFMLHFSDVTMNIEQKEAIAPTSGKHNKNQTRNSVRLFKTYTLKKGWEGKARKKAEITCPAWGVRGHYRHYRNGKTVFVEAYVKGREKEAYKGKEYNLLPYKDA